MSDEGETLPTEVREWLDTKAEDTDLDREDVLTRAVAALQYIEGETDALVAPGSEHDVAQRVQSLDEQVGDLEADVNQKIDDMRERVVQVKRETDSKAPADHDHPEIRTQVSETMDAVSEVRDALDTVEDRLDRVDDGLDNFEDILDYLLETTDDFEEKVEILARGVISLRERTTELESQQAARTAVENLQMRANRNGIQTAECGACGETVHLGLLANPACPHCDQVFEGVKPAQSFFGSATLTTGTRPALESGAEEPPETPEELFEETPATETESGDETAPPSADATSDSATVSSDEPAQATANGGANAVAESEPSQGDESSVEQTEAGTQVSSEIEESTEAEESTEDATEAGEDTPDVEDEHE